jgi:pyrimidine-nucleoside phosphorylase
MIGQSESVVPADRKMYALRDVTGTVESIPLITASIMSKKFAEGAEALVFDVKTGSGAFMKREEDARALARSLVRTGTGLGRKVSAVLTRMDQPLGRKIGNFLEVEESIDCLLNRGPADLSGLCVRLTASMLVLGGLCGSVGDAQTIARRKLSDGSAWKKFLANVEFQGGDVETVLHPSKGPHASVAVPVVSTSDGFVSGIDAFAVGSAGVLLGAGRARKEDPVLPGVGIALEKVQGDEVRPGDVLARVYAEDSVKADEALRLCASAYSFSRERSDPEALVIEEIRPA